MAPITPDGGDRRCRSTLANDKWLESAKANRDMVQTVLNSSRETEGIRGARQLLSPVRPSRYPDGYNPTGPLWPLVAL
jgi:hypothetical protein